MALSIGDAFDLIGSGQMEPVLKRFIEDAYTRQGLAASGEIDSSTELNDAFVAAVALQVMLRAPGARKMLGLKRRSRGDKYRIDELVQETGALQIARDYVDGVIDEKRAIAGLDTAIQDYYGESPKGDTTETKLKDLVERVNENDGWLFAVLKHTGGDIEKAEKILSKLYVPISEDKI
jgi:hypothetical protein